MEQKGYQRIELIPLLALIRDHNGDSTVYVYNGNLVSKTDADGYVTRYSYTALDLVKKINYNGAKDVSYQYNKVGELVQMDGWTGTNTFELDLLGRLQKMTDHKGNTVSYTYDAVGNQTGITYPDGSKTRSFYDAVYNLTSVIDADDGTYAYVYDDANRPVKLTYPNGWIEQYTYDAEGNLLKTVDTDPFQLYNKTPKVKYEYTYDAEGNVLTEFQRDSDATENLKSRTAFTYDALNRLTGSTRRLEVYPYDTLAYTYTYDTLGNLLKQSGPTKGEEDTYQYNDLNQMVSKHVCGYEQKITRIYDYGYTYDKRGNLVKEEEICSPTTTGPKNITVATYLYDETNRMVQGTNKTGEVSAYTFNGLGVRVGTELILEDNSHGYTDFHCQTPSVETGIEKPEVVKTDYVIDYTRLGIDQRVLVKSEQDGYDFFYTYGLDKLQVMTIGEGSNWWGQSIKKCVNMAYVHTDRLGSVVNLSDQYGRVTARADYTDWGEVRKYTDITVDGGFRRLLPEITYATHEYDDVLNQFYAKARMYDADNKRFAAIDPILNPAEYSISNYVSDPMMLVQYLYAKNNPIRWIDLLGLTSIPFVDGILAHKAIQTYLQSNFSGVQTEVAIKGVRLSVSGSGYADVIINNPNRKYKSDVYEIKPISAYYNYAYGFLAQVQLNEYVLAINNDNRNEHLQRARTGKKILSDLNGVILPFPGDPTRYIKVTTNSLLDPGMIYYQIFRCKGENFEYSYVFSPAEEKKFETYLKKAPAYQRAYAGIPVYGNYADSLSDAVFFSGISKWLDSTSVSSVTYANMFAFTKIAYPDGQEYFRFDGLTLLGNPKSAAVTNTDLISIYRTAGYQSSGEWKQSPFDAVLDAVQRGMIVMPAGVPIAIPMFA